MSSPWGPCRGVAGPKGPALELTQDMGAVTTMAGAPWGAGGLRRSHRACPTWFPSQPRGLQQSRPRTPWRCPCPLGHGVSPLHPPRGGPRCHGAAIRDAWSPLAPHLQGGPTAQERVLQPVPVPVSGGHPTAGPQRQLPTGHTAPQEAGGHRHGEPRVATRNGDCGGERRGKAEPARWGPPPGCPPPGERARPAPGTDVPSNSPILAFTALGKMGKEVAPGAELLCAVTPGHPRGHDAPGGSPRGAGGDAGRTPALPSPWI